MTDPARVAVIFVDMQNDILDSLPPEYRNPVVSKCRRLLESSRRRGFRVIHVGVCFRPGYPEVASTNRQFRGIRKAQILLDGTQGVQFVGDLRPEPHEMVVTKKRLSAAFDTELPVLLRSFLPEEVVLVGVATSGAILSTVRWLADADYPVTVLEDCCTDRDDEVQQVLMSKIFPRQVNVEGLDAFLQRHGVMG